MTKHELINSINLLIKEGFLLDNVTSVLTTGKLNRFFLEEMKLDNKVISPSTVTITKQMPRMTLEEFKDKAEVPFRIKTGTGQSYTVSAISDKAEKYFNSQIVGKVDMDLLIQVTKAYYADPKAFRQTLTNYITQGAWKDAMKEYENKPKQPTINPTYTGQRSV